MKVIIAQICFIGAFVISDYLLAIPPPELSPRLIDSFDGSRHHQQTDEEQCPIRPVFTIAPGGRTANIIWEYVSTMVVAKYLPHRQLPYTQHYILERIINIFENTTNTLPIVEQIPRHCKNGPGEPGFTNWTGRNTPEIILYTSYKTEELVEMYAQYKGNIIVNMYALYLEPVYRNMDAVRKELRYKAKWVDYVNTKLTEIKAAFLDRKQIDVGDITYVGIHVRRTDYIRFINTVEKRDAVDAEYFTAAMRYFRDNAARFGGTPIFVVVSDEKDWVESNLMGPDDVFVAASGDIVYPTSDLALLSLCNHSIIDYGTYGLWGAVYAGGHVVSVRYTGDQVYAFMRDDPKWHLADVTSKPIVIPETCVRC